MKALEWFTAAELARLALPGLPSASTPDGARRVISRQAQKESWQSRDRAGRGGGREYHVSSLPDEARKALAMRRLQAPATGTATPVPATIDRRQLKAKTLSQADARMLLLGEVDALMARDGLTKIAACTMIATGAAEGSLAPHLMEAALVANARRGEARVLSARSLRRWHDDRRQRGDDAVVPKEAAPRASYPDWLDGFFSFYKLPSKPSVRRCYAEWVKTLPAEIEAPSLRTVQRVLEGLGVLQRERGRVGPRELKKYRAYKVRDVSGLLPGDVYTADGHTHKEEVAHPHHGRPFRPEIVTVLDVKTRRAVSWSVGLAEGAWLVADALRGAAGLCIPAIFYTDGGSGFINEHLRGPVTGVLARLHTRPEKSLPYNSQARGIIERFHQYLHAWAKWRPGYVGKDMDREARQLVFKRGRQELRETGQTRLLMRWEEFTTRLAEAMADYNATPHSGLPKITCPQTLRQRHMSPDEAWQAEVDAGFEPVTATAEELEALFRPHEIRKVNRATVTLGRKVYYSPVLEQMDLHGRNVQVAYDLHDVSTVWVKDGDGRQICTAELDGNLTPYFPKSTVQEARENRAVGRMKRLEVRMDEVQAELGHDLQLDAEPLDAASLTELAALAPAAPTRHEIDETEVFRLLDAGLAAVREAKNG